MGILSRNKREFVYAVMIFLIWEIAQVPEIVGIGQLYSIFIFVGLLLVVTWIFTTYYSLSYRKVSEGSDVIIKVRTRERFFINFVLPILFYLLISAFLYFSANMVVTQLIIILCSLLFFVIFLNIKRSYGKIFTIERDTRTILTFVDIILYFLVVTGFLFFDQSGYLKVIGAFVGALIFLGHQLVINKQVNWNGLIVMVASSIFIGSVAFFFMNANSYLFSLIMTIMFYMVVSLWGIKLSGTSKISDYLPPILFSIMAFIIVISF